MLLKIFLLIVGVSTAELLLLLKLWDWTGLGVTMLIIVGTAIVGSALAKSQGLRVYEQIRKELGAGRMPTDSLLDAAMILFAGALLLTPGLLTDAFGLSLLLPPSRRIYRRGLRRWFGRRFRLQTFNDWTGPPQGRSDVVDSYVVEPEEKERKTDS